MTTKVFNCGKKDMLSVDAASADLRAALLMSNTDADTANDGISNMDDLSLDELDGSGYSRQQLANVTLTVDDDNDRVELDCDDIAFGALGAGTRTVVGLIVYRHVNDDTDSIPWSFHEYASAKTMDGSSFTSQINADGLIQAS